MSGFCTMSQLLKMYNQLPKIIWTGVSQIVADMEEVYAFRIVLYTQIDMHHVFLVII